MNVLQHPIHTLPYAEVASFGRFEMLCHLNFAATSTHVKQRCIAMNATTTSIEHVKQPDIAQLDIFHTCAILLLERTGQQVDSQA